MSIPAPPIEPRDHEAFARDMERLASLYAGWRPPGATLAVPPSLEALVGRLLGEPVAAADGRIVAARGQRITEELARTIQSARPHPATVQILLERDLGWALIQLAARMAEQLAARVNRAPEKHLLAFLELIGARLLPATPARAPLSFTLAEGSPEDVLVPARTQVAAKDPATGDEVVFETEQEVLVPRARLVSALVRDPRAGATADRADLVGAGAPGGLRIFDASDGRPFEHALYLACDEVLAAPGATKLKLHLSGENLLRVSSTVTWQYWNGAAWAPIVDRISWEAESGAMEPSTFVFSLPPDARPTEVAGRSALWLRALLDVTLAPEGDGRRLLLRGVNDDPHTWFLDPFFFGSDGPVRLAFATDGEAPLRPGERVSVGPMLCNPGLPGDDLAIEWSYRVRDGTWRPLGRGTAFGTDPASSHGFHDGTAAMTRPGAITFQAPGDWDDLAGERLWLMLHRKGRFGERRSGASEGNYGLPVFLEWNMPLITSVRFSQDSWLGAQRPVELVANGAPIDMSMPFHPFGERPGRGSVFYLRGPAIQPEARLTVSLALENAPTANTPAAAPPVHTSADLKVSWEFFDGTNWKALAVSGEEKTKALAAAGDLKLAFSVNHQELPIIMQPVTVNGTRDHWLRARIVQGDYGRDAQIVEVTQSDADSEDPAPEGGNAGETTPPSPFRLEPATLSPPLLTTLTIAATLPNKRVACDIMLTSNDDTVEERADGVPFPLFGHSRATEPALHLGLDRPLPNRAVDLFVEDDPVTSLELVDARRAAPPQVRWEYWRGDGWRPLGALDGTHAFAERGLVRFIGPADHAPREDFGVRRYWLRARLAGGGYPVPPRLRRVLLGTTWAAQASSVLDEPPAPSSGLAGQVVRLARAPVLHGERVEVFEPELHPDELAALEARHGAVARDPRRPEGRWVPWQEVLDFFGSGPGDRHYTLDRSAGELRFGDGRRGRVPPPGSAAIRAAYRTGGGAAGNLPAGAIAELKTAIPFLDGASNPAPAGGGAAAEDLARLRARAPLAMRHGDRAVAAADYEDLALAAAPDVARALALPPPILSHDLRPSEPGDREAASWHGLSADEIARHEPYGALAGSVGLIVVPRSDAARPAPSLALLDAVDDFVRARCPAGVALAVSGPEWVRVEVYAEVVPERVEEAPTVARAVEAALARFLHPLSGGDGAGWTFGRRPHRSDFFALLEGVPGVDHVRRLRVREEPDLDAEQPAMSDEDLAAFRRRFLVYSGAHQIVIAAPEGA